MWSTESRMTASGLLLSILINEILDLLKMVLERGRGFLSILINEILGDMNGA